MDRAPREAELLDSSGDRIGIFAVQGFLFFGNGRRVVDFVRAWLSAGDGTHYCVLDLAHATGADASAIDALLEAARLVKATHRGGGNAPLSYAASGGCFLDARRGKTFEDCR